MYIGRFAPSPTGPLHAGSLVAALASWLDARAAGGRWLVRIEDIDLPRCLPGADQRILQQLAALSLHPDEPPRYQSGRLQHYQAALDTLIRQTSAYACACTRRDVAQAVQAATHARHTEWVYPGTCRAGTGGRPPRAWRLACSSETVHWNDRRLGPQLQQVATAVGDFVLRRGDGLFAYQLAVVVDDAAQGVNHIVRGEDLVDNTARQILLQQALDLPQPRYLHTPVVRNAQGEKLSKQHGAPALDTAHPLGALNGAAQVLGLAPQASPPAIALTHWVTAWRELYNPGREP